MATHKVDQSDRAIAEQVGVSQPFVSKLRKQVITVITPEKVVGRDGKSYPATQPPRKPAADKQRAVESALRHSYSQQYSDRQIAEWVGVHHDTVSSHRKRTQVVESDTSDKRIGRDGKSYPATQTPRKPSAEKQAETAIVNTETGEVSRYKADGATFKSLKLIDLDAAGSATYHL